MRASDAGEAIAPVLRLASAGSGNPIRSRRWRPPPAIGQERAIGLFDRWCSCWRRAGGRRWPRKCAGSVRRFPPFADRSRSFRSRPPRQFLLSPPAPPEQEPHRVRRRAASRPGGNVYRPAASSRTRLFDSWEELNRCVYPVASLEASSVGRARGDFVGGEQLEESAGSDRHERLQDIGDDTQALYQGSNDLCDPWQLGGVFRERERRGRHNVLVGSIERLPYDLERAIEPKLVGKR